MSVLASQVITRLDSVLGAGKWTDAQKLEAVNSAIDQSWPQIRKVNQDSTQTIAATTYSYSPSATPEVEYGFAQAYATRTGYTDTLLRRVTQKQSGTTFTVYLDYLTASEYTGFTLRLVYTSRIARVTAASDAIELPLDYLYKAAALSLLTNKMLESSKADVEVYSQLVPKFDRDVERALVVNSRGQLAHLIPVVQGVGDANRQSLTSGYHS